jgi:hypothetical protein
MMIDLIIMMVAFSKLGILKGWVLALMIVKALWEVFKLMWICIKVGSDSEKRCS